jgi:4-aminobutyrate aminotransferase-like enzyme
VDGPSGPWLAHRSQTLASGLTRLMPALTISAAEVDEDLHLLRKALRQVIS